jgi:hypothetical protein
MNSNVLELLQALSPSRADDYQTWLEIGIILHSIGATCADWDTWSHQSPKYQSGECEKKWKTFSNYNGTPLGVGTLAQMAKEDGYVFDRSFSWSDSIGEKETSKISNLSKVPNTSKTPNAELREYINAVFRKGDTINFVVNSFEREGKWLPNGKGVCKSFDSLLEGLGEYEDIGYVIGDWKPDAGAWIRLNPVSGEGCKNSDIVEFRHALIESDSLPKDLQLRKIRDLNLPCAAIVDSAGKSIHAVVRIDAGNDERLYRERVAEMHSFLESRGFPIDKACKNPSRLSRMAGVDRNGIRQSLIAVNTGAKSYDEWISTREDVDSDFDEITIGNMLNSTPNDMSDALLGNRLLCRDGSMLIIAQSGIGKSVLAMQMAMLFALGRPLWGMASHCPRKMLLIQAENNRIDLIEPAQSIAKMMNLSDDEKELLNKNLVIISERKSSGAKFIRGFEKMCQKHRPDIVILDPLLAYIGDEISRQSACSGFLRNQLNPIIHKYNLGVIIMHHTGKPQKERNSSGLADLAYLGIGSSELVNFARAVSVITENADNPDVFEFRHVKRGKRAGMPVVTYLRHATDGIYWCLADRPNSSKPERIAKSKYDHLGLENFEPCLHDKDPSKSFLISKICQTLAAHGEPASTRDAVRVFDCVKKLAHPLIIYQRPYWVGSLYMPQEASHV